MSIATQHDEPVAQPDLPPLTGFHVMSWMPRERTISAGWELDRHPPPKAGGVHVTIDKGVSRETAVRALIDLLSHVYSRYHAWTPEDTVEAGD